MYQFYSYRPPNICTHHLMSLPLPEACIIYSSCFSLKNHNFYGNFHSISILTQLIISSDIQSSCLIKLPLIAENGRYTGVLFQEIICKERQMQQLVTLIWNGSIKMKSLAQRIFLYKFSVNSEPLVIFIECSFSDFNFAVNENVIMQFYVLILSSEHQIHYYSHCHHLISLN